MIQVFIGKYLKYTLSESLNYESNRQSDISTTISGVVTSLLVILVVVSIVLTVLVLIYKRRNKRKLYAVNISTAQSERYHVYKRVGTTGYFTMTCICIQATAMITIICLHFHSYHKKFAHNLAVSCCELVIF